MSSVLRRMASGLTQTNAFGQMARHLIPAMPKSGVVSPIKAVVTGACGLAQLTKCENVSATLSVALASNYSIKGNHNRPDYGPLISGVRPKGKKHMGMAACFASAGIDTLNNLRRNPEGMEEFVYPEDGEGEPPNYADVDKAWHCIHFMLTGNAGVGEDSLSLAILGGDEVGDDVGYGPARILDPVDVQKVASALAGIDDTNFSSRFDPAAMKAADIYLADMCVRDGTDALDYLLQNFHGLVDFYRSAAARGDGAILWVC